MMTMGVAMAQPYLKKKKKKSLSGSQKGKKHKSKGKGQTPENSRPHALWRYWFGLHPQKLPPVPL